MNKIFDGFPKTSVLELKPASSFDLEPKAAITAEKANSLTASTAEATETGGVVTPKNSALLQISEPSQEQRLAAEQYKIIRTKILHHAKKPRWIVVSSASSGDGKTVTAINFAGSLALKHDLSVLLLDGDLRKSSVSSYLGIRSSPGLAEVLTGEASLNEALLRIAQFPNLFVLPAGAAGIRAAELLDSERWRTLVLQIRARFNYVICDAPPIATVADYELLEHVCDGAMIVARPGHTGRSTCLKALETVNKEKLLGVVLNCVEDWWLWRTPAYGYYGEELSAKT